ncbi:hypothetical protein [Vreelandella sp. GE22]
MSLVHIYYIILLVNGVAYLKLRSSLRGTPEIYEYYFDGADARSMEKTVKFNKYILSKDRWNDGFNKRTLFWIRVYVVLTYVNILYTSAGILGFLILGFLV